MKETLLKIWNYLLDAGIATFWQLLILVGPIALLAGIMNFISRKNENLSYKVLGRKVYLYVFGWLGTSIHELGHAIFAIIFAHKISEIKLFTPGSGKSLGHVKHSYTRGNPYQTLGNFFIGLGPVLLGSFLLLVVTWLLFGIDIFSIANKYGVIFSFNIFRSFESVLNAVTSLGSGVWQFFQLIFTGPKTVWWKLVLFFYLFYAIGSSITLSGPDIKGAFRGFFYFMILLLLFNIATLWLGNFATTFFMQINQYLSGFYFLIIVSMGLNLVFIIVLLLFDIVLSGILDIKKPSARKSKQ
ncbi:MAG TPA: hypothetical protein P5210_05075 [Draconibacterium sp.]|nr:hypothetical protein [Draconibacterium sp.]